MEKEIFFIGIRKMHSQKKNQDYYVVDYVRTDGDIPKSDFISLTEYNTIASKMNGKQYKKIIGIFNTNAYDRIYLSDIK